MEESILRNQLFHKDYQPEKVQALSELFRTVMPRWTNDNPMGLIETLLAMKAYAPHHHFYAMSAIVNEVNKMPDGVPDPAKVLELLKTHHMRRYQRMKRGRAFEIFVKRILMMVGFSEVNSDGLYIFDGAPGQMIQGLGEAHNADVLLEPPVQTPFLGSVRLLIECKDYRDRIGLGTIRSALGLREDINHFDIVDINELAARRTNRRYGLVYDYKRFSYQVAVAAINGFTVPAQNFAATHRIPLIEFDKMSFWEYFKTLLAEIDMLGEDGDEDSVIETQITRLADDIGERTAIAITNTGQLLFLYRIWGDRNDFSDTYELYWNHREYPWELRTSVCDYEFQLPDNIMKEWLNGAKNNMELRKGAIYYKANYFSNMIVYYTQNGHVCIKMISINRDALEEAKEMLNF